MKRFIAAFLLATPLAIATDTLLPLANAGFEDGLSGWTLSPGAPAEAVPEAASLGALGLRVKTGSDFQISSTPLPVQPGETYAVEFWSTGSKEESGRVAVKMIFKDASGSTLKPAMGKIRKWPAGSTSAGPFWENSILAAAAPENAASLSIQIIPAANSDPGTAMLDDFMVKKLGEIVPMQRDADGAAPIPPADPARLALLEKEIADNPHRGKSAPRIVLKLDDFGPRNGNVHPKWIKVAQYAKEKNIPVTFGIVAKGLEEDAPAFFQWTKERNAAGEIEFWNHGYDHAEGPNAEGKKVQEFNGTGFDHQKAHMADANRLAREKLGFPFISFGAPFNATDANTVKVLEESPDIKVWMYGNGKQPAGKKVLSRCYAVTIESPTFIPNYADFLEGYAHNRGAEYFVMQGHPTHWNDDRWNQFIKIVEFLVAQKAEFVKASDFASK
ncbi:peptidoglycan/xylan/chitin deacetylase, PgdA/CDA1 family [Terrimicrobium sacchariphilum]|uniref:Peptidoglycan/xylan/chitin deacetylase, PgdA/CDA1 family n=1 Tax=Terrimicrobium sacchariphilum TaxID=690879 RepID=A0A146G5E1_TERSA|nr:DUF2334 domain-containing protein [Terrimicrobium sacchariphilum]GAT33029.1 peptidoglycan/xylan/chitin deacetylase, PgdA/CDA1 family [Terrimicrobium sacchariphilum]